MPPEMRLRVVSLPGHQQRQAEDPELGIAEPLAVDLGEREPREHVLARVAAALGRLRDEVGEELGDRAHRLRRGPAASGLDHGVGPAPEVRVVGARHAEQLGDHEHRQRDGDAFDEVEALPGRIAATLSRASSRTRGSRVATMRGVNALIASLRWRLCSGGSIRMIDGALSIGRRLAREPSRDLEDLRAVGGREEARPARDLDHVGVSRRAPEAAGRVPVQRILGAQTAEGRVRIAEIEVDLVGGEIGGHAGSSWALASLP